MPVGGWHTLKVYDMLGNEVATLVDEYGPHAGKYEIEFNSDSGGRPESLEWSGTSINPKAGDFVQTRKMMLIK